MIKGICFSAGLLAGVLLGVRLREQKIDASLRTAWSAFKADDREPIKRVNLPDALELARQGKLNSKQVQLVTEVVESGHTRKLDKLFSKELTSDKKL